MSDKYKTKFEWQEKIPKIDHFFPRGELFRDRIFVFKVESGKTIKISLSLSYDLPMYYCNVRVIEGSESFSGFVNLRFDYSLNEETHGHWIENSVSAERLKSGIVRKPRNPLNPAPTFNLIFVGDNFGLKVTYCLTIEFELKKEKDSPLENYLKLPELLFLKKELSDIKLVCEGKAFQSHKLVLSCQSNVFEAMFNNETKMIESESGMVKIDDTKADTLETMLYFMYHNNIEDKKMINSDLLILADRYNVRPLTAFCVNYFSKNLSIENALDVSVAAYLTNKTALFNSAARFVCENKGNLIKTDSWKELSENDPILIKAVLTAMLDLE